jgi:hypothetical protein
MFPSSGEGREIPTLLGPLQIVNLNHLTKISSIWGMKYIILTSTISQSVIFNHSEIDLQTAKFQIACWQGVELERGLQ